MRLSLIGSVMFESIAAGIGTQQVGEALSGNMTPTALAMAVWTMVLCSIGWVIFATIASSRMDKIQNKITGGNTKRMAMVSTGAIIACFSSFVASNLVKFNKEGSWYFSKAAVATIIGAIVMFVMMKLTKDKKRLAEWNLTIAILVAAILTAILPIGQ